MVRFFSLGAGIACAPSVEVPLPAQWSFHAIQHCQSRFTFYRRPSNSNDLESQEIISITKHAFGGSRHLEFSFALETTLIQNYFT